MKNKLLLSIAAVAFSFLLSGCSNHDGDIVQSSIDSSSSIIATQSAENDVNPEESTTVSEDLPGHRNTQKAEDSLLDSYELSFSYESGLYKDDFSLELQNQANAQIFYTLDGSDPLTSDTAILYTEPIAISDRTNAPNKVSGVHPKLFSEKRDNDFLYVPKAYEVDKATVVRAVSCSTDDVVGDVAIMTCLPLHRLTKILSILQIMRLLRKWWIRIL